MAADRDKAALVLAGLRARMATNRNLHLALESCVHCGECADSCHYYLATGDPRMTPAWKVDRIRSIRAGADLAALADVAFGSCTMCRRCTLSCPFGVDTALVMRTMRGLLTAAGVSPPGLVRVTRNQRETGNQMAITKEDYLETLEWLSDELEAELGKAARIAIDLEDADFVYVLNPGEVKYQPINLLAAARIFHVAGARWTMPSTGWDGTNFGLFSGDDDLGAHVGRLAYDQAVRIRAGKMVVSECGHGFRALRWEAPNWAAADPPVQVESILEVVARWVESGAISLDPSKNPDPVTYHDPCNLSRSSGITEEPRLLLRRSCSDFREMTPNRSDSFCCTGGGGAMSMTEHSPRRLASSTVKADQIRRAGAKVVATACHNCLEGLSDLVRHHSLGTRVRNVCEIVSDALVLPPGTGNG